MKPLKDLSIFQLIVLVVWSPSLLSQQSFLSSESTHPHTSTTEYIIWKSISESAVHIPGNNVAGSCVVQSRSGWVLTRKILG